MDANLLTSKAASQYQWIAELVNSVILPKFAEKNKSYGKDSDEFYNLRQSAQRYYAELYANDPYAAMAKVAGFLKDKHEVTLAKTVNVSEAEERMLDCIIYDLFRLRFKLLQVASRARDSSEIDAAAIRKMFNLEEEQCPKQSLPTMREAKLDSQK